MVWGGLDLGSYAEEVRLGSNQRELNYRIALEFLGLRSIGGQLTSVQEGKGLAVRKIRFVEYMKKTSSFFFLKG
jgi:hypothetical protein